MKYPAILAGLALALSGQAAAQDKEAPLFAEDAPLEVTISGPIRSIARSAERSTDPELAMLEARGESHEIELSARGVSRRNRDTCRFPPLNVRFVEKPENDTLFDMQRRLKLVTHCRDGDRYEQFVLREYAAYRLFNVITPKSLQVRLLRVSYVDDGELVDEKYGFFIEDIDDAAKRNGGVELDVESVPSRTFDHDDAARYSLFQYMIGNLDWAMTAGPDGNDCCHNSKILGASQEARESLTPVPYDFDFSGLVDTPYSTPPESIPVRNVTQRYYRGFCRHNDAVLRIAPEFLAARSALEAEIRTIPGTTQSTVDDMIDFLGDFFDDIANPSEIQDELLDDCR